MSVRIRAMLGVALTCLLAGCDINLSDVTLSNIGNGNKVDVGDVSVGDVNVGTGGGRQNGSASVSGVTLSRPKYRVRLGLDPRNMGDHQGSGPSAPFPDTSLLDEALVNAQAASTSGETFPVAMSSTDWKWVLPPALERVNAPNGQTGFLLVARPEATVGSHVLKVELARDAKIAATASVEILADGSADVVLE